MFLKMEQLESEKKLKVNGTIGKRTFDKINITGCCEN